MKKILIALVAVVIIAVGVNMFFPSVNSITDFKHINYTEAFDQKDSEYYVYFYQETCGLCQQFGPELVAAHNDENVPVYVVDMAADENLDAWYDWEAHDLDYTKVIGKMENGVEVLNDGESRALYPSNEGWTISTNQSNEIVAYNSHANNNVTPQSAQQLEISGTPTLLKVKDGQFAGYGEGITEDRALLATYGQ